MWVDATIAASFITDPKQSKVADKVAFAQAPYGGHAQGRELAVGLGAGDSGRHQERRRGAEVHQLGHVEGLHQAGRPRKKAGRTCPPARASRPTPTPEFLKAAKFADAEKKAIDSANPNDSTLPKCPYVGVQFAAIPEFQAIGIAVGQQMSAALAGKVTVDAGAERLADRRRARDEEGGLLQVTWTPVSPVRAERRGIPRVEASVDSGCTVLDSAARRDAARRWCSA